MPAGGSTGVRLGGTNLERAGDHNQRVTLHAIRVNGPVTRTELAGITGLTPPAIATITRRLIDDGLVGEAGMQRGSRGQPATRLAINADSAYSIGVNIDRDHITIVVVDFVGRVCARATRDIDYALPRAVRDFYQKSVPKLLDQAAIDTRRLVGIGIALPDDLGGIDLPGRPTAYAEWSATNVADLFGAPLDLPVFVENDAAAAAMGELQFGHGYRAGSFFYVLISTAMGGGVVVDGTYFRGADGRSGEIGFLLVDNGCGGLDQLQSIVSLSGLATRLARANATLADIRGTASPRNAVVALVDDWVEGAAAALVQPLIAVNCLLNPSAILVGGRLPARLVDRLAARTNSLLRVQGGHAPAIAPVVKAALSDDAPAVGAAILPFSHFLLPQRDTLLKPATAVPGAAASRNALAS